MLIDKLMQNEYNLTFILLEFHQKILSSAINFFLSLKTIYLYLSHLLQFLDEERIEFIR